MSEAFESIMRGLADVKAHREGKIKLKKTTIEIAPLQRYDANMIKTLRMQLGLSQSVFADALGVSKKTIEAWEASRNVPSGAACRFLEVIRNDRGFLQREKIVVYTGPSHTARNTKTRNSAKATSAKASKPSLVH